MTVTFSPETEAWIAERKRKGDDPENKAWLDERKREALLIDPATAEVDWSFGQTLDPNEMIPDLPEELQQPIDRTASAQALPFNLSASTLPKFRDNFLGLRLFLAIHPCSSGSNPRLREERPC
jgi:hypothetical protein